jgi:O-antigen ligase
MKISIKSMLFGCLALAMLVPPWRIAGIGLFDFCIYGVLALCVLHRLLTRDFSVSSFSRVELALIVIMCATLVTYAVRLSDFDQHIAFLQSRGFSTDFLFVRLSLYGMLTLLLIAGTFHLTAHRLTSTDDIRRAITVIVACGTLNATITLLAWLVHTGGVFDRYNFMPPLENSQGIHLDRMALTFLLAFAAWTSDAATRRQRVALLVGMVLTGLSIATVEVRLGWVTFVLTLILYMALSWKTLERKYRMGALTVLVVFVLGGLLFIFSQASTASMMYQQILAPSENSTTEGDVAMRVILFLQGLSVFRDHFIFGVGYGHFSVYSNAPILVHGQWEIESSPHNGLIAIAAETGVLGLACTTWLCAGLLQICRRARRRAHDSITLALANAVLSLVLVLLPLQTIANSSILPIAVERGVVQGVFVFWFLFGLTAASLKPKPDFSGVLPDVE